MNWTPGPIVSVVTAATGFVGALAAVLAVLLTRQERASAHRQFLYQKQFEAYTEIVARTGALLLAFDDIVRSTSTDHASQNALKPIGERMRALGDEIKECRTELNTKWVLFLPRMVDKALQQFLMAIEDIIWSVDNSADLLSRLGTHEVSDRVFTTHIKLIVAAQYALGIPTLTKDNLKLVGINEKKANRVLEAFDKGMTKPTKGSHGS